MKKTLLMDYVRGGMVIMVILSTVSLAFAELVHYYDDEGMIHYVNTDYQQVPEEYADQIVDQLAPEEPGPLSAADVYMIMLATYELALGEKFVEFRGQTLSDFLVENSGNEASFKDFADRRHLFDEAFMQRHAPYVQHFRYRFDSQFQLIERDYPRADHLSQIRMFVNGIISQEEFIKYQMDQAIIRNDAPA